MKKKLIEVALPLEAINIASAREKSIRHGHPSTLHLWWARRPLAACRAVLFASLVDDPSSLPEEFPTEAEQDAERQRLFRIIERLVLWENSNNPDVLNEAKAEILKSTGGNPPPVLDPFCGGGSIPLEAQRLGLEAHGSDLNPVAVLITKALIEIPPKFAGQPPVNPDSRQGLAHSGAWQGATGLAEDVRYYGKWMRDEAEKRIGHLYPKAQLPEGGEATVIAWIWARTVKCPNPACGCQMPLVRSFALSIKADKAAWVEPVIDDVAKTIRFTVKTGAGTPREATVGKRGAVCICCESPVPLDYVRAEGKAKRMGAQLMAIVAEGKKGRIYVAPTPEHEATAAQAVPDWKPTGDTPSKLTGGTCHGYGLTTWDSLFTERQLVALTTFSDLVGETWARVQADVVEALKNDKFDSRLRATVACDNNASARVMMETEYSNAIMTYISFVLGKIADYGCSICSWHLARETMRNCFARQAIPMNWDYAESNPFSGSTGNWESALDWTCRVARILPSSAFGSVTQKVADVSVKEHMRFMISTDPPYYDNRVFAQ